MTDGKKKIWDIKLSYKFQNRGCAGIFAKNCEKLITQLCTFDDNTMKNGFMRTLDLLPSFQGSGVDVMLDSCDSYSSIRDCFSHAGSGSTILSYGYNDTIISQIENTTCKVLSVNEGKTRGSFAKASNIAEGNITSDVPSPTLYTYRRTLNITRVNYSTSGKIPSKLFNFETATQTTMTGNAKTNVITPKPTSQTPEPTFNESVNYTYILTNVTTFINSETTILTNITTVSKASNNERTYAITESYIITFTLVQTNTLIQIIEIYQDEAPVSKGPSLGFIIGITVGCLLIVLILSMLGLYLYRKSKNDTSSPSDQETEEMEELEKTNANYNISTTIVDADGNDGVEAPGEDEKFLNADF